MSRNWNTDELAVDREDALKIAKEFQYIWTRNVLLKTGMDIEDCFPEEDDPDEMTLEQKINLRSALKINDILVLSSPEGGINIYFEKEIIGIWKKPYHILHEDLAQLDPKKKLYTRIQIKYWSAFDADDAGYEENEDEEEDEEEYEEYEEDEEFYEQ